MTSNPVSGLATPKVYDICSIRLTSPLLHIGSAVPRLNPHEFVENGEQVYLPNSDALARTLKQQGGDDSLDFYIKAINHNKAVNNLLEEVLGNDWPNSCDDQGRALFPVIKRVPKLSPDVKTKNLRPMVRNGMGQLYIPGSSIKGAIRTAVAFEFLKNSQKYSGCSSKERISQIEETLRSRLDENKFRQSRNRKEADDKLFMNDLFTCYGFSINDYEHYDHEGNIKLEPYETNPRLGPNTDIFRALSISDSQPLITQESGNIQKNINQPAIVSVLISSHKKQQRNGLFPAKYKDKSIIPVEVVLNVSTSFTITLDTTLLSWFRHKSGFSIPFGSVTELVRCCQSFAQEQWYAEKDYWSSIQDSDDPASFLNFGHIRHLYRTNACPYYLRFGWGGGLNGTTVGLLLDDEELRSDLRDACGREAPDFRAPKTRRTALDAERKPGWAPGWAKFEIL